ncbi:C-type lectin domain family 2 member D3-like [Hyperolius riggenbachi]|uniref:C-type lectin domain family 2 member D3-like n=1 Tax=Hyperolius riggenbachi TaxID=752182 RepID=UPI0035A30DA6
MGDAITYAQMHFSNKRDSQGKAAALHSGDNVTYSALKTSKEMSRKKKPSKTQQVSPQQEDPSAMYSVVNKAKKKGEKEKRKSVKNTEVSAQEEDKIQVLTVYSEVEKSKSMAQNGGTRPAKQEHISVPRVSSVLPDSPVTYEDVKRVQRSAAGNGRIKQQLRNFLPPVPGGRQTMILIGVLTIICVILLIVIIYLAPSKRCQGDQSPPAKGSASQNSSGQSLLCPDLWIRAGNKCYYFSEDRKPHRDVSAACENLGFKLAMVKEGPIRRLVNITGQEFWIGLMYYPKHGGVWTGRWDDGSMETVTEGIKDQRCAKLGRNLIIENCYTELRWICEKNPE